MNFDPKDVCFVGLGVSAQCYYRVALPAMELGCDWCGVVGEPPKLRWATGFTDGKSVMPTLGQYKIVVLQQMCGTGWERLVDLLQERGVYVVWETDDYIHGIKKMREEHDYFAAFDDKVLGQMERMMRKCDAIICSTPWIADKYTRYNDNAYICTNGIDPKRYELTIPNRETINIGWAGGTGHKKVVLPWFRHAAEVMRHYPDTCFVSVGQDFALAFRRWFGAQRALAIPFAAIEQYPGAMTLFDIALAPGGQGGFWRGKSDLRWLEASALGIPVIANPMIYPEIDHAVTGLHAKSPAEAQSLMEALIEDGSLRKRIGEQAKEFVLENRTIAQMAADWQGAFEDMLAAVE